MSWGSWGAWGFSSSYDATPEPVARNRASKPPFPICSDCGRPVDPRFHRCPEPESEPKPKPKPCSQKDGHSGGHHNPGHHGGGHWGESHKKKPCPPDDDKRLQIRTFIVVAEECVQKVGSYTIKAPVGISVDADGKLNLPVRLEPLGTPTFTPTVIENKLINEGFVRAKVIIDEICKGAGSIAPQVVMIPFQTVHDIKGIKPGDQVQECSTIEASLVSATPVACPADTSGMAFNLALKIVLKVDVVIARECIVAVPGEILRCLPQC